MSLRPLDLFPLGPLLGPARAHDRYSCQIKHTTRYMKMAMSVLEMRRRSVKSMMVSFLFRPTTRPFVYVRLSRYR